MTFNYRYEIKHPLVLIKTIFFYKCFFYKKKRQTVRSVVF